MEHQVAYSQLSETARRAWETVNGLPLTTYEQQRHAWDVLRSEMTCLADDPRPSLHVLPNHPQATTMELYVSGAELAALRVMIAWLKAADRAGTMRDLPMYPDLAEAIVSQVGPMPWPGVWHPGYLSALESGETLTLHPQFHVPVLTCLLEAALAHATHLCPGWPASERNRLIQLLYDVWCWLQAMQTAYDQETAA